MAPKMKKAKINKQITQQEVAKEEEIINQNFSLRVVMHVIQQHLANNMSVLLGHVDVGELNESARKLSDIVKGSDHKNGPKISSANAVWLDRRFSLKAAFKKILRDVHDAQVRVVDFVNKADKVVKEANSWAEEKTNGLIKQILTRDDIKTDTCLLLANALYFKGTWHKAFESKNTKHDDFTLLNGDKVRVPFMNQWNEYFDYGTSDECQVLKMSYRKGASSEAFSMYVFLPYEKNGLPNLLGKMMIDPNSFINQVKLKTAKISKLSILKFDFESNIDLKKPMKELGLTLPFKKGCMDFSGIIDSPLPLYVSDVVQKCRVKTNERGTEAAAATHARVTFFCAVQYLNPPPPINFVADHPFMFMTREDNSGCGIFVGTILNPR
ncbi:hypothetical protein RND81_11G091200 [Saponaria officinalis]|uniref:Serpin domain-containing protein n=1 Tax=Saponaria officinalis TaxID=3572 RepID=A0AAW1HLF3_SAPOF